MTRYKVRVNGILMGEYESRTRLDALNAYACDAGYLMYSEMVLALASLTSHERQVVEVEEIVTEAVTNDQISALLDEAQR